MDGGTMLLRINTKGKSRVNYGEIIARKELAWARYV
jgi:uncharacterized protein YkwD